MSAKYHLWNLLLLWRPSFQPWNMIISVAFDTKAKKIEFWRSDLIASLSSCKHAKRYKNFFHFIYIYIRVSVYIPIFFLRVSHPTPSFKGQNELWLAKVFGSVHFLQGVQTPVTDLEVSGEASDAQLEIVDMLVGYSFITRNASDIWLYLFG